MATGIIHHTLNVLVEIGPSTTLFAIDRRGVRAIDEMRFFRTALFNGKDFCKSFKENSHDIP